LQANYNLMLCYNGLGDQKRAQDFQKRYLRFKADEAAQALTGPYRLLNPEDNRERQAIHEHGSTPLETSPPATPKLKNTQVAQQSKRPKKTAAAKPTVGFGGGGR
jgi:hypothetical protein